MSVIPFEEAVFLRADGHVPELQASSPGFSAEWLVEAERLVTCFGDRPAAVRLPPATLAPSSGSDRWSVTAGVTCPQAVFALPLGDKHAAVVHVADQTGDQAGGGSALGFHFLVLPRSDYRRYFGDPFELARRLPPAWDSAGALVPQTLPARTLPARTLPARTLPAEPLPPRTVGQLRAVLQRVKAGALRENEDPETVERTPENAQSPALLGGVQILVDGGRVVFERPAPEPGLIEGLWTLLPNTTRAELWPASFAFGNALGFDAVVVPRAAGDEFENYYGEEQAAEYPPGRYELALQTAAEHGDQRELDRLLNRRSLAETWRLGLTILVLVTALALAARLLDLLGTQGPPTFVQERHRQRAMIAAGLAGQHDLWNTLGLLPVARTAWNRIDEQQRVAEEQK